MNSMDMMSPEKVAEMYGGDKRRIGQAAQRGLIDPTVAVMAGMFIDRMRSAAVKEASPQTSVAEEVMAPAMAAPATNAPVESGLAALPVSEDMVPSEYAGGGVVAFANGGLSDDEEDDDSFDKQLDRDSEEMLRKLMAARQANAAAGVGAGLPALGSGLRVPERMAAAPSQIALTSEKESRNTGLKVPSGHKYEDRIISEAERLGVDPAFALKIAMRETGGMKNPETARSSAGAVGIMQLMPGTAKDMGVKDPLDPDQNIAGGVRYAKMMLDKYGDPKLAAIAYNWGPGNTDKWLRAGADMSKLPKETRNYVANLKEGGAVRFQNTGLVTDPSFSYDAGDTTEIMPREELVKEMTLKELQEYNRSKTIPPRLRDKVAGRGVADVPMFGGNVYETTPIGAAPKELAQASTPESRALQAQYEAQDIQEGDVGRLETPASTALTVGQAEETKPAGQSIASRLEELLSKREKGIGEQRQQDKYMALLTAGLGMMGGTSPRALQNIGAGALKGVEYARGAAKERSAEENALMAGRLKQLQLEQYADTRKELASQGQEAKFTQQLSMARNNMIKNVAAAKKIDLKSISDPNLLASIEAQADAMLARDPAYQAIFKKLYGSDFAPAAMAAAPVDYAKTYGLTPRK